MKNKYLKPTIKIIVYSFVVVSILSVLIFSGRFMGTKDVLESAITSSSLILGISGVGLVVLGAYRLQKIRPKSLETKKNPRRKKEFASVSHGEVTAENKLNIFLQANFLPYDISKALLIMSFVMGAVALILDYIYHIFLPAIL